MCDTCKEVDLKNEFSLFNKIERMINSSTTLEQLESTRKYIMLADRYSEALKYSIVFGPLLKLQTAVLIKKTYVSTID
jgi:hypothetical protein